MVQKKMTATVRAKKVKEMSDSISVRNHLFTMINTGRMDKNQRAGALKFLDYIDSEVLKTCLEILPKEVESVKSATNSDFVQAREKKQAERVATKKAKEAKKEPAKGSFRRAK